jgi:hypothetical protein
MTTIRTLRKLTKVAAELEQLSRAMGSLAPAVQGATEAFTKLAEAQRQAPVKGRIDRA